MNDFSESEWNRSEVWGKKERWIWMDGSRKWMIEKCCFVLKSEINVCGKILKEVE